MKSEIYEWRVKFMNYIDACKLLFALNVSIKIV